MHMRQNEAIEAFRFMMNAPNFERHIALPRTFNRQELAKEAHKQALKLRQEQGINFYDPICPFDLAVRLGVEVWLQNIPSMEGMFCRKNGRSLIVLASERPAGRQNYTCAHEIGHHMFGHGQSLDEMLDKEATRAHGATRRRYTDPKEFSADSFAGFLLMPRAAVDRAFARRNFNIQRATPEQIFLVANVLGVGYATLVTHLHMSLRLLDTQRADELKRATTKLPKIRQALIGSPVKHLTVVDDAWEGRPVDLHIGDHLILPPDWTDVGSCLEVVGGTPQEAQCQGRIYRAIRQGEGELNAPQRTLKLRVSRQGFEGRSIYRHWDDPDDEGEDQ